MNTIKNDTIKAAIVLVVLIALGAITQMYFVKKSSITLLTKEEVWSKVDSTWHTKPGQEHSLQTSFKYYGRLVDGRIVSSHKRIEVGDSILSIYYRYENK